MTRLKKVFAMAFSTILAASWSDGLFVSDAGGFRQELTGKCVRSIAADGRGGALAIVDGHSVLRRAANGEWSTVVAAASELSCCVAVGESIYVGTDDARVLRIGAEAALIDLKGFQSVAGRETWYAGTAIIDGKLVGPPLGIRSIASTCDQQVLLANVHVGGIPISNDRGASWRPSIEVDADVHQVCAHPSQPRVVIAAAAVGLCVSYDGGATWAIEQEGLHALHCSAVAFVGDDILVSASEDPFSEQGAIYKRRLNVAGPLRRVGGGLPEWTQGRADTGCMASKGPVVAIVDGGGNFYVSEDAAQSWLRRPERIAAPSGLLVC
jgi:hypothetical protein